MNTQNNFKTHKTNFVKRMLAAAAVIGVALAGAPTASASAAACDLNPASQGWVPIQVAMEYEVRCGSKGGALAAPAKSTTKLGCTLNPSL